MFVSFFEKKNKNVVILSTVHDSGTVSPDTGKPKVIEFYSPERRSWLYGQNVSLVYDKERGGQ